jgi:pyruvate ferredoxin oxidoreductase delta subunit
MDEGLMVPAIERGYARGPRGQSRSKTYLRGTTKSMRPVVRFDLCTKCTLCWLECPDECFDPVQEGFFDVNYEYCTGCGKCAQVCPVNDCIVMVDELRFKDNDSPWGRYKKDPKEYVTWAELKKGDERVLHNVVTGTGVRTLKTGATRGE